MIFEFEMSTVVSFKSLAIVRVSFAAGQHFFTSVSNIEALMNVRVAEKRT